MPKILETELYSGQLIIKGGHIKELNDIGLKIFAPFSIRYSSGDPDTSEWISMFVSNNATAVFVPYHYVVEIINRLFLNLDTKKIIPIQGPTRKLMYISLLTTQGRLIPIPDDKNFPYDEAVEELNTVSRINGHVLNRYYELKQIPTSMNQGGHPVSLQIKDEILNMAHPRSIDYRYDEGPGKVTLDYLTRSLILENLPYKAGGMNKVFRKKHESEIIIGGRISYEQSHRLFAEKIYDKVCELIYQHYFK